MELCFITQALRVRVPEKMKIGRVGTWFGNLAQIFTDFFFSGKIHY
jgi:hypothetical protein